jgi:hypothetical protein
VLHYAVLLVICMCVGSVHCLLAALPIVLHCAQLCCVWLSVHAIATAHCTGELRCWERESKGVQQLLQLDSGKQLLILLYEASSEITTTSNTQAACTVTDQLHSMCVSSVQQ